MAVLADDVFVPDAGGGAAADGNAATGAGLFFGGLFPDRILP